MDNFFSSPKLFLELAEKNIWCTGTIRQNKVGWPKELADYSKSKAWTRLRGNFCSFHHGQLIASIWMDNQVVPFLSTAMGSVPLITIERRGKTGVMEPVSCPALLPDYNKFMGGVDKHDQRRSYYSTGRRTNKWWHRYFWYLIDVCVVNSFILYNIRNPKDMSHLEFLFDLIKNLTQYEEPSSIPIISSAGFDHWSIKKQKRGVCCQCSSRKVVKGKEVGKRQYTNFQCSVCQVWLCVDPCMKLYHQ
jgi:hypothetical protein